MTALWNLIFFRPIFNTLILLYDYIPGRDLGVAIILLTILIKVILWPLTGKMLHSQKALADLQPKVEELKKKFGDNKEEMSKELMALYSREKVSPAASCLPLLIQLPVFIALYQALRHGISSSGFDQLYAFVPNPGKIGTDMFGWLDLAVPSIALALLAGATQFVQARMTVTQQQPKKTPGAGDEAMLAAMNKQMMYVMPALTAFIGWRLPAGLALYWCTMNILTVVQQYFFFKRRNQAA